MKSLQQKREEAIERQLVRDGRTIPQQLAHLDRLYGPNQGAKKERAKLAERLAKAKAKPKAEVESESAEHVAESKPEKKARKKKQKASS